MKNGDGDYLPTVKLRIPTKKKKRRKRLRPKPAPMVQQQPLGNEDWEELRELILSEARAHDDDTAFTAENINLHAGLQFILHIYQCGRERTLPPEWENAWNTMQRRRRIDWQEYQEALDTIDRLGKTLAPFIQLNLSDVVGMPISAVLEHELKAKTNWKPPPPKRQNTNK